MSEGTSAPMGIAEVSAKSGISQRVLRVWESRHGFPVPTRLPNGRRAYTDDDVLQLREVVALRDTGLSLPAAIERARTGASTAEAPSSIFAGLRMRRPELSPLPLPKGLLTALSKAIEDEYCASGKRGVVFGSFQEGRHYRAVQERWRDMSRTSHLCAVFADFDRADAPDGGPIEVRIPPTDPFAREWSVVCDAPGFSVSLLARERPGHPAGVTEDDRLFDTLWSVEPDVTREASRAALSLARDAAPDLFGGPEPAQMTRTPAPSSDEMRALTALTNRMMAYTAERATAT